MPRLWRQLDELYQAALKLEPSERSAFLAQCDPELRREVELLLASDQLESTLAASMTAHTPPQLAPASMLGRRIGPYEITGQLGGGGMGLVYCARDEVLGRMVALKFIRGDHAGPGALKRFFREARAASALNHPNIITIHEIGEADGATYIVMELVEGKTLRALITDKVALEQIVDIGSQTARALAAAHAAGIVHRDIKPENIMVRSDGYIKVLDFGLATRQVHPIAPDQETLEISTPGTVVGTISYMSPEQAHGLELTGASDVFSLGIVLYELLTGTHPFHSATRQATLNAMLTATPVPPRRINPTVPASLEILVLAMLDKDARKRPAAAEIAAAIRPREPSTIASAESVWVATHAVGREAERAELRAAYDEARNGHGLLFCVSAEPGLGKTTLVGGFLSEISGATIARGRCSERLAGADAYLPVFEALSDMLRAGAGESVGRIMKAVAPSWYEQIASGPDASSVSTIASLEARGPASQERMKREIAAFLHDVSRIRPVILFIEDMHWADISTVDLINYLANQCGAMTLMLIVTYRPSELLASKHPFRSVKMELQSRQFAREIVLGPLSRDAFDRYLDLEFPGRDFPAQFAELVYSKTEGHPLFMADLLRDLRHRGAIVKEEGKWKLVQTMLHLEETLPATTLSMIERKIEPIGEEDRRLLNAAAVQGPEFDSAVLAEVLERNAEEVEDRLNVLERVHSLVRMQRELEFPNGTLSIRYRFVHVLYQNVLADSVSASRRARYSLSIGRSLENFQGSSANEMASALAYFFETGRDFARAASYYLSAAKNAARVFAHREAILLLNRGLNCLQRVAESTERASLELALQLLLGSCLMTMRGYADPDVLKTYRRAGELSQQYGVGDQQLAAVRGHWAFHLVRAEYATAIKLANQLMDLAKATGDPVARVEAHFSLGFTLGYMGDTAAAANHFEAGIAVADPRGKPDQGLMFALDTGVGCRAQLATQLWYLGYPDRAVALCEEALARAHRLKSPYNIAYTLMSNSLVYQYRGEPDLVFRDAEASMNLAIANEYGDIVGWALQRHGWSLFALGRVDEGLAEMRHYQQGRAQVGARVSQTNAIAHYAECLLQIHRLDEGLAAIEECLQTDVANGERFFEAELIRLRGEYLAALERADEAEACFRQALNLAEQNQTKGWELRAAMSLMRLLRARDRASEGRAVLEPVYAWFTEGLGTQDLVEARRMLAD